MNKAILIGNLTRDPEMRTTGSGTAVTSFSIAVQRRFANKSGEKETDFIPIVAWKNTAEICMKYLRKGSKVAVSGSIQTRSYEASDGSRRYITEIVADEVEFLTKSTENIASSSLSPASPVSDMQETNEDLPF